MDREHLFSDAARFNAVKDLVDANLKDRTQWYDRAVKNRAERFMRTNTVKPMYEGAPNLVVPAIDGQSREPRRRMTLPREPPNSEGRQAGCKPLKTISQ